MYAADDLTSDLSICVTLWSSNLYHLFCRALRQNARKIKVKRKRNVRKVINNYPIKIQLGTREASFAYINVYIHFLYITQIF